VNYFIYPQKHRDLFAAKNLRKLKRASFPALVIPARSQETSEMESWLARQTFKDYILAKGDGCSDDCRYRLLAAGVAAASRLPPEAIECAISFESNSDQDAAPRRAA
jgi:hypothetical protein